MNDLAPPKLFLDASLIIAAMLSENSESPGRKLLKLSEVGLIHLWVSEHTLRETEKVLERLTGSDFPALRIVLAETLVLANVSTTSEPNESTVRECVGLTNYLPDAKVLAAAIERDCEVLVTYDKEHLLQNPKIGPPNTRLVVMSGGEALDWALDQVKTRARLRMERQR